MWNKFDVKMANAPDKRHRALNACKQMKLHKPKLSPNLSTELTTVELLNSVIIINMRAYKICQIDYYYHDCSLYNEYANIKTATIYLIYTY